MNFDISHLLDHWDYQPGQIMVRRFIGKDGVEKLQLRVDLGLLQMNVHGRPDGKRPLGHASLFDYQLHRVEEYRSAHEGDDEGFVLNAEECSRLQTEAIQYHHRSICLLQLEDFIGAVRDTQRNLRLMDFVDKFAEGDELAWSVVQFRPQVLMNCARSKAGQKVAANDFLAAMTDIEETIEALRTFFQEHSRLDLLEASAEIQSLEHWRDELNRKRPLTRREQLELDLHEAVNREDYEKAAEVRDALRNLKPKE